jgi:hypothetical protein
MQEAFPRKNSPCVSRSPFFLESIPQFPGKGCLAENLNTDEVRAESRNGALFREALKGESVLESGITSERVLGSPRAGGFQESHSEFTVNSP